jgi:enoyl-CoA hydratase
VVVLEAEGADFCAGWSPDAREALLTAAANLESGAIDLFAPIAELRVPVIAALQGEVSSAGLELALCCDIRIAAEDARFSLPEVAEGILPLAGGSQRLPRVAGRARALSMLLLSETIDAGQAYACGLVSRVVAPDRLAAEVAELATTIASRGPLGLRYAKEAAERGLEMSLEQGLRFETDLSIVLQTTRDRAEGLSAFFEKRPPRFEGR